MPKTPLIPAVVREARDRLRLMYGDNLRCVILYGSHARGEATPESDIDLVIVLDDFQDAERELERMSPIASELSLQHDVLISLLVMRAWEYGQRNTPLLLNVRREGIPV